MSGRLPMTNSQQSSNELAERLKEHVQIDSVVPEEQEYARFIEQQLEAIGLEPERYDVDDDRFNIVATMNESAQGPTIGLYGHLDTVPAAADWEQDPWTPQVENDRFFGLGACDMKAGNLAILETLRQVDDCSIKVAFGVDEEYMSKGSTALNDAGLFDDVDCIFVPEPADRERPTQIGMGRRGRISIDVTVEGQAAHAATPEAGESAIQNAMQLIREINAIELGTDPDMGEADLTIRSLEADAGSLSLPDTAQMIIDRHMVPGEPIEQCLDQVRQAADRVSVSADVTLRDRPTPYLTPYKTSNDGLASQFLDTVEAMYGEVEIQYGRSVADENRLAELDVPVMTAGPIGDNIHQGGEWVNLESVADLIELYSRFLHALD